MIARMPQTTEEIAAIFASKAFRETAIKINNDFHQHLSSPQKQPKNKTETETDNRADTGIELDYIETITRLMQNASFQVTNYSDEKIMARVLIKLRPQLEESKNRLELANATEETAFLEDTLNLIDLYINLAAGKKSPTTTLDNASELPKTTKLPPSITPNPIKKSVLEKNTAPKVKEKTPENELQTTQTQTYGHWIALKLEETGIPYNQTVPFLTKNLTSLCNYLGGFKEKKISAELVRDIIQGNTLPSENLHKAISFICKTRSDQHFDETEFNNAYKKALGSQITEQKRERA